MNAAMMPVQITHFSDILCVWAYISQFRVAELQSNFPQEVEFEFCYFNVFGDVQTKMAAQWAKRGGVAGYAQHVHEIAARFDHVSLSPDVWGQNIPTSSLPAHLIIAAARLLDSEHDSADAPSLDSAIREAFFSAAVDVSRMTELLAIADHQGIEIAGLKNKLETGQAFALVSHDFKSADALGVSSSPTMIFNEGRQTLSGNVGYRILEANIRELLQHPAGQQSWC
jgi:predicted DsbA family dithiol-disulfide isomerase